ncbi:uncharacterized protein LOC133182595 [Saccostrea echinata]|uniref:uncharacterized protein LOC133182595 n=1 Tax=Saccostrea echinata TaxID=191078 RepID=UPI002A7FEC53|nr:uncharacterized protein LOC133182595 [Saccostrea echinata]
MAALRQKTNLKKFGSPCYTLVTQVSYYQVNECICHGWWGCTMWRSCTRSSYYRARRCCPGYQSDCTTPICHCQHGGTCVAPGVCRCPTGYSGNNCERPICFPPCQHGRCYRPQQCSCYPGYSGNRCQIPICSPKCQHGGSCVSPNTCSCLNGYSGHNCNIPICRPVCRNGGTCDGNRICRCTPQYTGSTCTIPVCQPICRNGGTCIAPNYCACDKTYTGPTCATPLCSHHSPCFPGRCSDSIHCQCSSGFSGLNGLDRCKKMTSAVQPSITQCTSFLAFIERTGRKREMYRFMTDSSEPNSTKIDTMWINQNRYNYINVRFSAIFTPPENIMVPDYVQEFKFGIVSGQIQLNLAKVDRNDATKHFTSINKTTLNCPYNPGSLNPNGGVYWCNFTNENFDRILEHGDNLTISVIVTNGGYRKLKRQSTTYTDTFIGQKSTKATRFRFDFVSPRHCAINNNCSSRPFSVSEDITKNPLYFTWDGWTDEMSGIHGFSIQEYLLKPDQRLQPNLTEPDPWKARNIFKLDKNTRSFTRTPSEPGMYSYILNVMDSANNTEFARSLVLYDPLSEVTLSTINNISNFKVTSGVTETNFTWQDNLIKNVEVTWKNHFRNSFLEDNKLLLPVSPYKNYDFYTQKSKLVLNKLDDYDGNRTLKGIQNVHGIVRFDYAFRNADQGNSNPTHWNIVDNMFSETQTVNFSRRDGDGIYFWVKATDALGNTKSDMTQIYFDSTPPRELTEASVLFMPNTNVTTYHFSSRLHVITSDEDSGIYRINWKLISNNSGIVFKSGYIEGNQTKFDPGIREGYRIPKGDIYYYSHFLDIDNCWMVVAKENYITEYVMLELTVYNMAMKSTVYNHTISDLPSLNGMDQYSGPMNLHVAATYDNGVRLKWTVAPSCYSKTNIVVKYRSSDGRTFTKYINTKADWFDLTGLNSETSYNLSFVTEYGDETSDPIFLSFKTKESPTALTGGAVAGISIVFLLLIGGVIFMVVLWRMGRLSLVRNEIQRRVTVVRTRINNRFSNAHENPTYDDDIYIYGHMEFNESDSWILPASSIVFESLITTGRFADIYRAMYRPKGNREERGIVVAKTLKSGYSEENALMMRAKINFFGKEVGEHQNILLFIGAVVDNRAIGPYMILEFCEKGQLRDWLLQQKNATTEDTVEQLYRITYGISKGMCYLETKQIVHKKLAARNVLLTDELEPKIYGFGPEPLQKEDNDADGDIKSDEKERIPIKWTAPECLTSMKNSTTKSDVWSFGIVVWEIFSLGDSPYPGMRSRQIQEEVKNGHRMKKPEFANDFYCKLMIRCWQAKPKQRPTFKEIMGDIGQTFGSAPSDECYYYSEK